MKAFFFCRHFFGEMERGKVVLLFSSPMTVHTPSFTSLPPSTSCSPNVAFHPPPAFLPPLFSFFLRAFFCYPMYDRTRGRWGGGGGGGGGGRGGGGGGGGGGTGRVAERGVVPAAAVAPEKVA